MLANDNGKINHNITRSGMTDDGDFLAVFGEYGIMEVFIMMAYYCRQAYNI